MARTETTRPMVGVVIPAAGQGKRFGSSENKIWARICGKTVLERTLTAFSTHNEIDCIVVVAGIEDLERVQDTVDSISKVVNVVPGGDSRSESVRNGLLALPAETEIVLVHDAARPLVTGPLISNIIETTMLYGAAVPGTPLSDTVKRADVHSRVRETIPRSAQIDGERISGLTAVQTPQGARLSMLVDAYSLFPASTIELTDEASLIEAAGGTVMIVRGDTANIKITRPEDVGLAERLLGSDEVRTGFGYDVHAFAEPGSGRPLWIGGVNIPHDRGLDGHSDADVALHAVCDALLGGASLGDIGILFPNTDEKYRNISSLKLLAEVGRRLKEEGWRVGNIDATILAEAPKLMPHRDAMARAIGDQLGIGHSCISIKATTSEGLGFVGRKEGIACWAVATLRR